MSVRHDWYQADDKLVVTVMLKNAVEKNYKCEINEDSLLLTAENYELSLQLLNPIVPEKSSHKATPHKVEIVLIKRDFGRWTSLERKQEEEKKVVAPKHKKPDDWEKLAKEVEKEKDEVSFLLITF
jgi:suppressor of G2 allele of SKP1